MASHPVNHTSNLARGLLLAVLATLPQLVLAANTTLQGENSVIMPEDNGDAVEGVTIFGAESLSSGSSYSTLLGLGLTAINSDGSTVLGYSNSAIDSTYAFIGGSASYVNLSDYSYLLGDYSAISNSMGAIGLGASLTINDAPRAVAIGYSSGVQAGAFDSVAIGSYSVATTPYSVSFGNDSLKRLLTNVAAGTTTYDAVNFGQLEALAAQVDDLSASFDAFSATQPDASGSTTSSTPTTTAYSDGDPYHDASVTVSSGSVHISAGDPNTLDVTATGIAAQLEAGSTATIKNAAGEGLTVNDEGVAINTDLDMEGNRITDVGDAVAGGDAVNLRTMQSAIAPLDARLTDVEGRVNRVERRVDEVEKKVSSGVALALALAQPVTMGPGQQNAITAGVASFNGQSALSVSYNRLVVDNARRQVMVSGGFGVGTGSKAAARVGLSLSW